MARKGEVVAAGAGCVERLCHQVALIPRVGQLWHTRDDRYVLGQLSVRGRVEWTLVEDVEALLDHYQIAYTRLEVLTDVPQLEQ